jgi:hypothetical protein
MPCHCSASANRARKALLSYRSCHVAQRATSIHMVCQSGVSGVTASNALWLAPLLLVLLLLLLGWAGHPEWCGQSATVLWPHRSGQPTWPSTPSSNTSSSGTSQSALEAVAPDTLDWRTA